jgi:phosphoenolpyruvate carboxykinase (ATP)
MLSKILKQSGASLQGNGKYYGLDKLGIVNRNIISNPTATELYEVGTSGIAPADPWTATNLISSAGALVAYSGQRTGRVPKEKRVVLDDVTRDTIWWGDVNIAVSPDTNKFCRDLAVKYLNQKSRLYIIDGYAGWDPKYRLKVRVICSRSYHALFMKNMLIRPTP